MCFPCVFFSVAGRTMVRSGGGGERGLVVVCGRGKVGRGGFSETCEQQSWSLAGVVLWGFCLASLACFVWFRGHEREFSSFSMLDLIYY